MPNKNSKKLAFELIVDSKKDTTSYALLKQGKLIELYEDMGDNNFNVGDIYFAKIKKLAPGLNAAFVDLGYKKDAFLHYHDLGPKLKSLQKFIKTAREQKKYSLKRFELEPDIDKNGVISDVLKAGQQILVQVVKEPISTKGPRISSELSLPGRFLVLVPFSDKISVSQKIEDRGEKDRLKKIMKKIKPKGFGLILRTVAQDQSIEELQKDMNKLLKKWGVLANRLQGNNFPTRVLGEKNSVNSYLRDVFNDDFKNISINDEDLVDSTIEYLETISPKKSNIVKTHNSNIPIFEKFGVEKQIKTSFGRVVPMTKGAYLIIEHTEAMHVIDVNSGGGTNSKDTQEENALFINKIAAEEIARQLKLRDMGGIIVVDFIDMHKNESRKELYQFFSELMGNDRAKNKVLPPSKFGLVQITRQRVRPELNINIKEPNPDASKTIDSPLMLVREITNSIDGKMNQGLSVKQIHVHPFVAAFLKQGLWKSIRFSWFLKHKKWVKVVSRDSFTLLQYQLKFDQVGKTEKKSIKKK